MLDAFKLAAILISGILWGVWLVLALRKKDVHPLRETLEGFSRLGWMKKVGVLFVVVQLTMFGGAKHGGTNDVDDVTGTNGVELVEGGTNGVGIVDVGDTNGVAGCDVLICTGEAAAQRSLECCAPQPMSNGVSFFGGCGALGTVRPTPYRLESVSTNEGYSYAMPAGGTIRGTWHLTGAYEDVRKVALDGFVFPLGSDLCTSLWAYTWGKIRPQLKNASNEIAAVGAPMSAIPDVSRFWTAATSNDTYLLTWENFAAGRQSLTTNNQQLTTLSAQLELRRNGDFITRSNDVECVYRRVIEPNPIVDPINPPDSNDPTKPLYPYGPVQNLSVIEETNAYCWVDIVVNAADAWVRFEGDGASNLADPSFAAKAGETNHVVILIGKTYKVTCDMPFTVVGKSDPALDEWWSDDNTLWLNWPVNIWSVGDDEEPPLLLMGFGSGSHHGNGFMMYVSPSGLGGGFNWTNSCCSVSGGGHYFSYNCNDDCRCRGCAASGYFSYEGYRLPAWGGNCGCSYEDEPNDPHDDAPDDPPDPPGASISFSHDTVIFEDEHEESDDVVVPRRSSETTLTCSAHGGPNGGSVRFEILQGEQRLYHVMGRTLPIEETLVANESVEYEIVYQGKKGSGPARKVKVKATFTDNNPDEEDVESEDELDVVEIEIMRQAEAPSNSCPYRHKFGVRERVTCNRYPASANLTWSSRAGSWEDAHTYLCPLSAVENPITATCGDATFVPNICVVAPNGIETRDPRCVPYGARAGRAGWIGLQQDYYVLPFDVSFSGVAIEEVPCTRGSRSGYFDRSEFDVIGCHSWEMKAGRWNGIGTGNKMNGNDTASITLELMRVNAAGEFTENTNCCWSTGWVTWDVPFGWGEPTNVGNTYEIPASGEFNPGAGHRFDITPAGDVTVSKFGNSAQRLISGKMKLNGEIWTGN